jgi:hypothetical protein
MATEQLEVVKRINRDMINAWFSGPGGITETEARYLVDLYYLMQKARIRVNNEVKNLHRDAEKSGNTPEPHDALLWVFGQFETLENQVKRVLKRFTESHQMSWFFEQTFGVGPVISAGLLAYIDIHRAPSVGNIISFAGWIGPEQKWEKGQKRPWCTPFRTLCWKIGDSFVKFHNNEHCFYGLWYERFKQEEIDKNEKGLLKDEAKRALSERNFKKGKTRDIYESGMLPPAHIDARARRKTVKLFLSHLHECWRTQECGDYGQPYEFVHLGHVHKVEPPQVPPA